MPPVPPPPSWRKPLLASAAFMADDESLVRRLILGKWQPGRELGIAIVTVDGGHMVSGL